MSTWQKAPIAVPLAALGAALGLASLLGEWSRAELNDGTTAPALTIFSRRLFGIPYTLALIAMLTMVAIALFGRHRRRSRGLQVAGLVLAALLLAILGVVAYALGTYPYRVRGSSFDSSMILGWGIYAAFGAWAALAAALLLSPSARRPADMVAGESRVE